MLERYTTGAGGKRKKLANIYTFDEHGISRNQIDPDALRIIERLGVAGFDAYVVGGAVRDLLLGKRPKDFDIATSALPRKIRRMFANSRIIGRRFQLVHVHASGKIIEVSTFRADRSGTANVFGSMAEDVRRRDFSMNALYYDPRNEYIVDYVDGFRDIRKRRIRSLNPVDTSFPEDPVRMIRAVRYACTTGFTIGTTLAKGVRRHADCLARCPVSRLTEELLKILESGNAASFMRTAKELGILVRLLPEVDLRLSGAHGKETLSRLTESLSGLDTATEAGKPHPRGRLIQSLAEPFIDLPGFDLEDPVTATKEVFAKIKEIIRPLTPPNIEVERAARALIGSRGGRIPSRRRRNRRR